MRKLIIAVMLCVGCQETEQAAIVHDDPAVLFVRMAVDGDAYDLALEEFYKLNPSRPDYAELKNIKGLMWARKNYGVDTTKQLKEDVATWVTQQ